EVYGRHLELFCVVEDSDRVVEAFFEVSGAEDDTGELAVGSAEYEFEVSFSWRVGWPVEGPPREYCVMTTGTSFIPAHPRPSTISENPGPEVDVAARAPASAAPVAIVIAAISSSV